MTWIKETKTAIYWMDGDFYIDKLDKKLTSDGVYNVDITEMKVWFNRTNYPLKMQISDTTDEPTHKAPIIANQKPEVEFIQSPNYVKGRSTHISSIILHNTDSSFDSAVHTFLDGTPGNRVSAHYVISREGKIVQMVADVDTAWHARGTNASSIGIEHEADKNHQGLTEPQQKSSVELIKFLMKAYAISIENIKPHRDMVETDCPCWLWATDEIFDKWKTENLG